MKPLCFGIAAFAVAYGLIGLALQVDPVLCALDIVGGVGLALIARRKDLIA